MLASDPSGAGPRPGSRRPALDKVLDGLLAARRCWCDGGPAAVGPRELQGRLDALEVVVALVRDGSPIIGAAVAVCAGEPPSPGAPVAHPPASSPGPPCRAGRPSSASSRTSSVKGTSLSARREPGVPCENVIIACRRRARARTRPGHVPPPGSPARREDRRSESSAARGAVYRLHHSPRALAPPRESDAPRAPRRGVRPCSG